MIQATALESGALLLLSSGLCQCEAPRCEESAYAVPKASKVTRIAGPPPKEACNAP